MTTNNNNKEYKHAKIKPRKKKPHKIPPDPDMDLKENNI
jgi:hypothetical protein